MTEPQITPHKVTKPIQLLAAWLTGLTVINATFLTGAATINQPPWGAGLLIIAAVVNVPLFLLSLFLLQTKFRPQMQEDSYYSRYLEKTYSPKTTPTPPIDPEKQIRELSERIIAEVAKPFENDKTIHEEKVMELLKDSEIESLTNRFKNSRTLSELYMYPSRWKQLVARWGDNEEFNRDLGELLGAGLVVAPEQNVARTKLTRLGQTVARKLDSKDELWNKKHPRNFEEEVKKG